VRGLIEINENETKWINDTFMNDFLYEKLSTYDKPLSGEDADIYYELCNKLEEAGYKFQD